jgi:hypothetical protein
MVKDIYVLSIKTPVAKVGIVLLAHRVHPIDKGSIARLRALVCNAVGASVIE